MGSCPDTDIDPFFFLYFYLCIIIKAYVEDKLP